MQQVKKFLQERKREVMLKVLLLSFIGALVYTILTSGVGFWIANSKKESDKMYYHNYYEKVNCRIGYAISMFIVNFIWMALYLYSFCNSETFITVLRWIWPPLVFGEFILFVMDMYDYEWKSTWVIVAISIIACCSTWFSPVQTLVYVHDMENVDITYAVTSDEIIAKVELKVDSTQFTERYCFCKPEMRKINDEDIAVYQIKNNSNGDSTEYIPGYAIMKNDEIPQIIPKRIYFDTSYVNKRDALRTIRRKYPTVILGEHKFDIDDNWNPYEIYTYRENLYSSNGKDYGIIILNLLDGSSEKYPASEGKIPSWVDFKSTYPR